MKRRVVIKMGGSTLDAANILASFAEAVSKAVADTRMVVVHGGGKDIARQLNRMGREFTFINGLRVTDNEVIDVVEMVLSGLVNKWIVRALEAHGVKSAGVSGTDRGLFTATKLVVKDGDLGYVGAIEHVDAQLVDILLDNGITPVVSPISTGPDHRAYNVNADHAAGAFAEAWAADDLIYITDVPGISIGGSVRTHIHTGEVEGLIAAGEITGGMIPKIMSCAAAVTRGVKRVHIIGWKGPDSIIDALDPRDPWGTIIEN